MFFEDVVLQWICPGMEEEGWKEAPDEEEGEEHGEELTRDLMSFDPLSQWRTLISQGVSFHVMAFGQQGPVRWA